MPMEIAALSTQVIVMDDRRLPPSPDQPPHEKPFIHLRRFLKFERDYKRSRLRLTAMELAVYLILGVVLLMAWTIYPIFERLH